MSGLFDEFGFEAHCSDTIDLAIDIVVAFDQANVLNFGTNLDHKGLALDFQILYNRYGVAIVQHIAIRILDNKAAIEVVLSH